MASTGKINNSNAYITFRNITNVENIGTNSFDTTNLAANGGHAEMAIDINDALIEYGTIDSVTITYTCYGSRTNSSYKQAVLRTGYITSGTSDGFVWKHTHENVGRGSSNATTFTDSFTPTRSSDGVYRLVMGARNLISWLMQEVMVYTIVITIYYTPPSFTISTGVSPAGTGTVTGSGTYVKYSNIQLRAESISGYRFAHWNDGNTDNPRTVVVTGNATYTAIFEQIKHTLTTVVTPEGAGTVIGGGVIVQGETVELEAIANPGWVFTHWTTSSNENWSREWPTVNVSLYSDVTYTAWFKVATYTIKTYANYSTAGTVTGDGEYEHGSTVTLTATPNEGYRFKCWKDNENLTDATRTITVFADESYTAIFEKLTYTLSIGVTPAEGGTVSGEGGVYEYGDRVRLEATPSPNYKFVKWHDGLTDDTRYAVITSDVEYIAIFEEAPPEITHTQMLYSNKQISAENKVPAEEYFRIVVGVRTYD